MKESEIPDAWIILDGENQPFVSTLIFDGEFAIKETDDHSVPKHLIDGLSCISDIWVVDMSEGVEYSLN